MSPSGRTIEEILDSGAAGLLYFEHHLPILRRLSPESGWAYSDLCARYDEQRGLDLDVLGNDAHALAGAVDTARGELERQATLADTLADGWSGAAAEAALADVRSDRTLGSQRTEATSHVALAMAAAVDRIREAVETKANAVGRFDPTGGGSPDRALVDGRTIEDVARIHLLAFLDPLDSASAVYGQGAIDAVSVVLPAVIVSSATEVTLHDRLAHAQQVCDEWLRTVFAPIVSAACENIVATCTSIDSAVRDYLTTIAVVAESVDTRAFPGADLDTPMDPIDTDEAAVTSNASAITTGPAAVAAEQQPQPSGAQPSGAGASGAGPDTSPQHDVAPGQRSPGRTDGATGAPGTSATPEGIRPPLESLFSEQPSCSDVVAAIEQAGHELTERMKSVLDDAFEALNAVAVPTRPELPRADDAPNHTAPQDDRNTDSVNLPGSPMPAPAPPPAPASPGPPVDGAAERGHLEAALDGHSARIALANNGNVSLDLGTPDGVHRRFELKAGPFGLPIVEHTVVPAPAPAPPSAFPAQMSLAEPIPGCATGTDPAIQHPIPTPPEVPSERPVTQEEQPAGRHAPAEAVPSGETAPRVAEEGGTAAPPELVSSGAHLTEAGPL